MKKALTAFTWGYWGWGTKVEHFLAAAAAHERTAGFEPPAFADVRIRRSVRAEDFRDNNFGKIVGPDRYKWFPGLGNAMVAAGGEGIQIAKPEDAQDLLDYIEAHAKANRRVLFFCACEFIKQDGKPHCHRHAVADLLLVAARERGIALTVVEWPGDEPEELEVECDQYVKKTLANSAVAIGPGLPEDGLATLPWGSLVYFQCKEDAVTPITTGPAVYEKGLWRLPVFDRPHQTDKELEGMNKRARQFRKLRGLEPRNSKK